MKSIESDPIDWQEVAGGGAIAAGEDLVDAGAGEKVVGGGALLFLRYRGPLMLLCALTQLQNKLDRFDFFQCLIDQAVVCGHPQPERHFLHEDKKTCVAVDNVQAAVGVRIKHSEFARKLYL